MIRLATQGDAAQIAAIYRPFCDDNCVSFETTAPDAAEMATRIAKTLQQFPWLVDETGGVVNGYAYATSHRVRAAYRWAADVAVYIDSASHRGGVGRQRRRRRHHRHAGANRQIAGLDLVAEPAHGVG